MGCVWRILDWSWKYLTIPTLFVVGVWALILDGIHHSKMQAAGPWRAPRGDIHLNHTVLPGIRLNPQKGIVD